MHVELSDEKFHPKSAYLSILYSLMKEPAQHGLQLPSCSAVDPIEFIPR